LRKIRTANIYKGKLSRSRKTKGDKRPPGGHSTGEEKQETTVDGRTMLEWAQALKRKNNL
jgi:hypothetical protein